jgi:hypothetical protein
VVALFVDGKLEDEGDSLLDGPIAPSVDVEMTLGGQSTDAWPGIGEYDEVAVWHRGLSNEEIADLFHRGARDLRFRVRACDTPDCADEPDFTGPDGAPFFADRRDVLPDAPHPLPPLDGAYFQYEALFTTRTDVESPALGSVTITAQTQ